MAVSVALRPAAKPRNRSIEARRAARMHKFERERLIVDSLNRGVSVAEIAGRIGVTEKRMRAVVKEILARRMPAAPEDFAALQVSRLNEALLVAYGAMSDKNLRAVALVVRIVRELDRYHGFAAADRRRRRDPRPADAGAPEPLALAGDSGEQAFATCRARSLSAPGPGQRPGPTKAPAEDAGAPVAPPANRPEMAPQASEKMEFAPEKGVDPKACEAAPEDADNACTARRDGAGAGSSTALRELLWSIASSRPHPEAPSRSGGLEGCGAQPTVRMNGSVLRQAQDVLRQAQDEEKRSQPIADCSNEASPPADAPKPSATACAGAEMAPQAIDTLASAPGNGVNPAAGPTDGTSAHAETFAMRMRCAGAGAAGEPDRTSARNDGKTLPRCSGAGSGSQCAGRLQAGEHKDAAQRHGGVLRRRLIDPGDCQRDARIFRAALRCGMSTILPSIPSVPAPGFASNAATIFLASSTSASDGA